MALIQLEEEQIRTWTRAQKDEWWFKNVYRGDMPQLTIRSALTGALLGAVLAATALYIGAKTGITIGVGLTSVILAFALYRIMHAMGVASDFTILENNCTQSIATAAGYMTAPLISSLAAYMLVTGRIIPWWHMVVWMCVCSIIGVLLAFPMKRRFINEEQLPFPEGRASGVVLDALYTGSAKSGMFKARLLAFSALLAGLYQFIVSDGWMKLLQFKILRLDQWAGLKEPWTFHERLDSYYYAAAAKGNLYIPTILGTDIRQLGLRLTLDAAMLGIGGLIGIVVATSCLLGAFINFVILAPILIQAGDIAERVGPSGAVVPISRAEIVNQWSLWWAVTMMVVGSLVSLFGRPEIFKGLWKRRKKEHGADVLKHIEFPLWISAIGVPLFSVLGAWVTHEFFGVPWLLAFISLPLIFVLTVICTNSMALTSWTPTGALSKITQFTMGAIDRTNPGQQPDSCWNDRRDRGQLRQPAVRYQARLHAGRQTAPAGDWPCDRHIRGRACVRAAVLPAVSATRCERRALYRGDGVGPVRISCSIAVEGRGRADRQGLNCFALFGDRVDGRGGGQARQQSKSRAS